MITLKLQPKRAILAIRLSMCYLNHPLNRRYPFPYWREYGMGTNEPTTTNQGWWMTRSCKRRRRIWSQANHRKVRWLRRIVLHYQMSVEIGLHRICRCQSGIEVRLSISGVPRWVEWWMNIIQGDVLKRLVWAEEWTHNWCTELAAVEHIDHHRCLSYQYRCI